MGWYDCVASKYGCRLQGTTDVALTVLDVLGYLDEIPVCTGYEINGEVTTEFPTTALLEKAKPVYEKLPGWKVRYPRYPQKYEDLPENCRKYIEFIEKHIGFPITMIIQRTGQRGHYLQIKKRVNESPGRSIHGRKKSRYMQVPAFLPARPIIFTAILRGRASIFIR